MSSLKYILSFCSIRFSSPVNWSGFKLVGRDVEISLSEIRHAMLDQHLDRTEDAVNEILNQDLFSPQPNPPTGKNGTNPKLL